MRRTSILAVALVLALVAGCSKEPAKPSRPGTFEQLFAGTKAPGLVGPLAELGWGMPAGIALPKEAGLAAGTLSYVLVATADPSALDQIKITSTAAADPAFFTAQWGAPYAERDGRRVWLGAGTRATVGANTVELVPFTPLADFLGSGDWLALEKRLPLGPTDGQKSIALGRDELGDIDVLYDRAADDTMRRLEIKVLVPATLRPTRGKLVLDRFGLTGDAPWKAALGARQVSIDEFNESWRIVIAAPPAEGAGSAGSGSGSGG